MIKYYDNFIKYDYFDKYFNLKTRSYFNNKLGILVSLHLRFIKKENDARIKNTLMFLEVFTASKFFIKKFSFFFSKSLRSKYSELFICCFIKKKYVFIFIKFLNVYFINFYKKFILNEVGWIYSNGIALMIISKLNKLFNFNRTFKKQDKCNIIFFDDYYNNMTSIDNSKVSFLINKK